MRKTLTPSSLGGLSSFGLLALIAGGLPTLPISIYCNGVRGGRMVEQCRLAIPISSQFLKRIPGSGDPLPRSSGGQHGSMKTNMLLQVAAGMPAGAGPPGRRNAAIRGQRCGTSGGGECHRAPQWRFGIVQRFQGGVVIQTASRPAHGS